MTTREFLEKVLAPSGTIFIATPAERGWFNRAHTTIDSALAHVNHLTFEGKPAYVALGTYKEARYWDAEKQKYRTRTQANVAFMRSFYLDLDVDPTDPKKFPSKRDAVRELKAFYKKVGLPQPMLIDSGGGIHAYWALAIAVPVAEWRPVADRLKAICVAEGFRTDMAVPADQARVLRVPGSYNVRRNAPVSVLRDAGVVSFVDFSHRVTDYAADHGARVPSVAPTLILGGSRPATGVWEGMDNIGTTNDPLNFDRIVFSCGQLGAMVATHGSRASEPLWRASLGIVKFCEPRTLAGLSVSDRHADFSTNAMVEKINNWHAGPTRCDHFHALNSSVCEACPHWTKLTSPAQLGRHVEAVPAPKILAPSVAIENDEMPNSDDAPAAPTEITLPEPPAGYKRRKDGAVIIETEDNEGRPRQQVVCPYDLFPLAIRAQNGIDQEIDERSMWRVYLPLKKGAPPEPRDFAVPLGLLADPKGLAKLLFSKGIVLGGDQSKMTQLYMTAYLQKLAREAGREKLYERLGWHDEHKVFVLGDRVVHQDGTVVAHSPSDAVANVTKGKLKPTGTLGGWKRAMSFYNRPGYEGHRMFLYHSFGSILFHMNDTGNNGVLFCASGASGRGKTSCLKAMSSVWGHPMSLLVNGNKDGATINALYSALGCVHSLPFLIDDVTERENEDLRKFLLNFTQGEGKRRLQHDGIMSSRFDTWATMGAMTTNADTISAMMATGKDLDPHLMRLISVDFRLVDTGVEAKLAADQFLRELNEHHGLAGPLFAQYVAKHYAKVRDRFIENVEKIDRLLSSSNASAERYWSAAVAACYTAAQICAELGLLDFPFEDDLQWMVQLLVSQRLTIRESGTTPAELLAQFLDSKLRNTLILSAKSSSNIDNVVQKPLDEMEVRKEDDVGLTYISRSAMLKYCAENRIAFRTIEKQLEESGILVKRAAQKVLGADTVYRTGQTRCWLIDNRKLDADLQLVGAPSKPASTQGNFTMH